MTTATHYVPAIGCDMTNTEDGAQLLLLGVIAATDGANEALCRGQDLLLPGSIYARASRTHVPNPDPASGEQYELQTIALSFVTARGDQHGLATALVRLASALQADARDAKQEGAK